MVCLLDERVGVSGENRMVGTRNGNTKMEGVFGKSESLLFL